MFNPVNRYILIKMPPKPADTSSVVLLPEDYKPEEQRYSEVTVLRAADDVRFDLCQNNKIIVDRSMVEQITIGSTNYDVILDNYVIGITE
jgi:co-chaperonin GroES (HSP10)|tara:strand:- start:442 stop:711 length:270 start_codon:yes stop_codon:yes gene_type:complete